MLLADTIIEQDGVFLRNLIKNAPAQDVWSTASGSYPLFTCYYENQLKPSTLYYVKYNYKYSTSNQSPTWVAFYLQGGMTQIGKFDNPVMNTEYTLSGLSRISTSAVTISNGAVYNGNSNAISGVSAQIKNIMLYDVTELFAILKALEIATTEAALKTWCDNNLQFSPSYTNYDIRSLIQDAIASKVFIKGGNVVTSNFVEADGMRFYSFSDTIRSNTYFDTGLPFSVYNNSGGGTVTLTRINGGEQNSPFYPEHPYICQITTNGTASPGAGGFYLAHTAGANKIFIERFVAKVPVGYTVTAAYNSQGTGSSVRFITPTAGTGEWEEYAVLYRCGTEGSFSTGGHVYITGSNNKSVTWYVAYANNCEITSNEKLKNFSILKNKEKIKEDYYFTNTINTLTLTDNSLDFVNNNIPAGWEIDTTDYAGNAKFSLIQPVNAAAGVYGGKIPIDPTQKYKISYWVKCKRDMTSFLTAIKFYMNDTLFSHAAVNYKNGTKTYLTAALNNGDTQMTVKSNNNWGSFTYSRIGFRTNTYKSYNDKGTSGGYDGTTGLISGVSGNTIVTFNTAYTGSTMAANTYVVESYDGGTYPYPIQKASLPTDNTWQYVEGYFGMKGFWDGNNSNGSWGGIPYDATHIQLLLNYYTNTGTVPIKYSDIKIEPVSGDGRHENKIQIIGG